jgi:hypothetical protein
MTFWGLIFVLSVIAIVVFFIFKLLPPYLADLKVGGALDSLAREAGVGSMTRLEISKSLEKRFDIDDIAHVRLDRDLFIEARGRTKVIRIRYEAVVPIVFNISALLEFDHIKEVRSDD